MLEFKPLEKGSARRYYPIFANLIIYLIKFKENNLVDTYKYPLIDKSTSSVLDTIVDYAKDYREDPTNNIKQTQFYLLILYLLPRLLKQSTK